MSKVRNNDVVVRKMKKEGRKKEEEEHCDNFEDDIVWAEVSSLTVR
jgi:hypothetical protein